MISVCHDCCRQRFLPLPAASLQALHCDYLCLLQGPADQAVEEVHAILRAIVNMVLNSEECVALQRYIVLKREIMTTAAASLDGMRDDARKMVANMVEMERSYLTAEVFREILASSHAIDEISEEVHVRPLDLCYCLLLTAGVLSSSPENPPHLTSLPAACLPEAWFANHGVPTINAVHGHAVMASIHASATATIT